MNKENYKRSHIQNKGGRGKKVYEFDKTRNAGIALPDEYIRLLDKRKPEGWSRSFFVYQILSKALGAGYDPELDKVGLSWIPLSDDEDEQPINTWKPSDKMIEFFELSDEDLACIELSDREGVSKLRPEFGDTSLDFLLTGICDNSSYAEEFL